MSKNLPWKAVLKIALLQDYWIKGFNSFKQGQIPDIEEGKHKKAGKCEQVMKTQEKPEGSV